MTARGRVLSKLTNGSLPPWAIKVLIGAGALMVSWGVWVTVSTFNTNNTRFSDEDRHTLSARVAENSTDIAVQDQRFLGVESDISEIKETLKEIEALIRNGQ